MTDQAHDRIARLRASRDRGDRVPGRRTGQLTATASDGLYNRTSAFDDKGLPTRGPGFAGLWSGGKRGKGWG